VNRSLNNVALATGMADFSIAYPGSLFFLKVKLSSYSYSFKPIYILRKRKYSLVYERTYECVKAE